MHSFSTVDAEIIANGIAWQTEHLRHPAVLAAAFALSTFWVVRAALDLGLEGKLMKGILRLVTVGFAWAITIKAESVADPAEAATTGSIVFPMISHVADRLTMDWLIADASFTDEHSQFPLAARLQSDFASELGSTDRSDVTLFALQCLSSDALASLRSSDEPGAVSAITSRAVPSKEDDPNTLGLDALTCNTLNDTLATSLKPTAIGSPSYFSIRRATAREEALAILSAVGGEPDPPGPELSTLLRRILPEDKANVTSVATWLGEVSAGVAASFVFAPIFVLLPGGLMNLGLYAGALTWTRGAGFFAFRLHRQDQACVARLGTLDSDSALDPLHAFSSYFVAGNNSDRTYESAVHECLDGKKTTLWLSGAYLALGGMLTTAAWVKVNGSSA